MEIIPGVSDFPFFLFQNSFTASRLRHDLKINAPHHGDVMIINSK